MYNAHVFSAKIAVLFLMQGFQIINGPAFQILRRFAVKLNISQTTAAEHPAKMSEVKEIPDFLPAHSTGLG